MSNFLSQVEPWDDVAKGYQEFTRVALANLNDQMFSGIGILSDWRVLDIACGPGTTCLPLSSQVSHIDAVDFSQEMIDLLKLEIDRQNIKNVSPLRADGQNLPFNEPYDLIYSFFGLMFFPDRQKGFREIHRLLKPDGLAIVSSWPPASESTAMVALGEALAHALREQNGSNSDGPKFCLQTKDDYATEIEPIGLQLEDFKKIRFDFEAISARSYFDGSVRGGAPLLRMKKTLSPEDWQTVETRAIEYLNENHQFPTKFHMTANYAFLRKNDA